MKVKELIEELKKMPPNGIVELGSPTHDLGEVKRVVDFGNFIEIQSDYGKQEGEQ